MCYKEAEEERLSFIVMWKPWAMQCMRMLILCFPPGGKKGLGLPTGRGTQPGTGWFVIRAPGKPQLSDSQTLHPSASGWSGSSWKTQIPAWTSDLPSHKPIIWCPTSSHDRLLFCTLESGNHCLGRTLGFLTPQLLRCLWSNCRWGGLQWPASAQRIVPHYPVLAQHTIWGTFRSGTLLGALSATPRSGHANARPGWCAAAPGKLQDVPAHRDLRKSREQTAFAGCPHCLPCGTPPPCGTPVSLSLPTIRFLPFIPFWMACVHDS